MLFAAEQIDKAIKDRDISRMLFGIQSMLNAGANLSKIFWGSGGKLAAEREALRKSINLADDSVLQHVVMRNNFEHIDERIDRWWQQSAQHNYVDRIIGKNAVGGVATIDMFRCFDPASGDVTFWGDSFNIRALLAEAKRIHPLLVAEAAKPHH